MICSSLARVGAHAGEVGRQPVLENARRSEELLQHGEHAQDDVADVHDLERLRLASAVGKQLARERCAALGRPLDRH